MDGFLDEYCLAFGYLPESVPTKVRLESLDLHDILVDMGKIIWNGKEVQ